MGNLSCVESIASGLSKDDYSLAIMSAQERLLPFASYVHCGRFEAPYHLRKLASALEDVENGSCKRLIIAMPPRMGKTHLTSETFPAWYLGKHPDHQVIAATYAQEFAEDIGRKVRNTMLDPSYPQLFPASQLAADSASSKKFYTINRGVYHATGIDGQVTGKGAHLLLIDDPIKNRQDADSPTIRKNVRDFYQSTAYTRLMPGGAVVVIATRWHESDLTGWLLSENQHENWRLIEMPAINSHGEALWPERYPIERLRQIERTLGSREWSALYQQQPAPMEGLLFKTELITPINALPSGLRMTRGWDLAATAQLGTNDPDWTVGALLGRDNANVTYICDIVRFRGSPLQVEQAIANTAARDGQSVQISIPQDPGQAGKSQSQSFVRMLSGYNVESSTETGEKSTRAAPFAAQVEAGNVRMLNGQWNRALLDEMAIFPAGRHDDQVDALSRAFSKLFDRLSEPARTVYRGFMRR